MDGVCYETSNSDAQYYHSAIALAMWSESAEFLSILLSMHTEVAAKIPLQVG